MTTDRQVNQIASASPFGRVELVPVLLACFAFTLPIEGIATPLFTGTSVSALAGLGVIAGWVWELWRRRRLASLTAVALVGWTYAAWTGATWLWSIDRSATVSATVTSVQLAAFATVMVDQVRDLRSIRWIAGGFITGCAVASAEVLMQVAGNPERYGKEGFPPTGADPNAFSGAVCISIALAGILIWLGVHTRVRAVLLAYIVVTPAIILATFSRTGFLVVLVVYAVLFTCLSRRLALWAAAGATALLVAGQQLLSDQLYTNRYWALIDNELGSAESIAVRWQLWEIGLEQWTKRPLVGWGARSFPTLTTEIGPNGSQVAHNSFVSALAETGLVGAILFVIILGLGLWKLRSVADGPRRLFALPVLAGAMTAFTLTWERSKILWFSAVFVAVLAMALTSQRRRDWASPDLVEAELGASDPSDDDQAEVGRMSP